MSKFVVINNLTLDGAMQAPGGPGEDTRGGFEHGGCGSTTRSRRPTSVVIATYQSAQPASADGA